LNRLSQTAQGDIGDINAEYELRFLEHINDDLDTPGALAVCWEVARDTTLSNEERSATLKAFDAVLGLNLGQSETTKTLSLDSLPVEIQELVRGREQARLIKNWIKADELREKIEAHGYSVKDTESGPQITSK